MASISPKWLNHFTFLAESDSYILSIMICYCQSFKISTCVCTGISLWFYFILQKKLLIIIMTSFLFFLFLAGATLVIKFTCHTVHPFNSVFSFFRVLQLSLQSSHVFYHLLFQSLPPPTHHWFHFLLPA